MTLQLVDVDHSYGRHRSLRSVSLTVRPGDCYGFIGHNGAGKTTAMRIALGLLRPAAGRVLIDGFDAVRFPREARARTGGLIETTHFYPWVSARDNLVELARLQGLARREAIREADRQLDVVGLSASAHRRVGGFSQGMRQRLALAQALLGDPPFVLLDEPQNGLDPEGIADLRAVLIELTRRGDLAVLLSSHQLREVTGLCNRIGVLREGRMLLEQDTDSLLASGRSRYELGTEDDDGARAVLEHMQIAHTPREGGGFLIELGEVAASTLVRELVARGIGVGQITPRPTTLEEVYLRLAETPAPAGADRTEAVSTDSVPAARRAPRWPVLRMLRYDLHRASRRWPVGVLLAVPAAIAFWRVAARADDHRANLAEVADRTLHSTSASGFEALGLGLGAALPAAVLILTALATQSIAGDRSLGTLRNIALRPLRRAQIATGKALALAAAAGITYLGALAAAAGGAAAYFDFGDRLEITREGEPELVAAAADVGPYVLEAMLSPVLPLFAYCAIGFAIGSIVNRGIWALGLGLTALVSLDLGRALLRRTDIEGCLPSAHLPSPTSDSSFLSFFYETAIGNAGAYHQHATSAYWAPLAWMLGAFAIATICLGRKRVP